MSASARSDAAPTRGARRLRRLVAAATAVVAVGTVGWATLGTVAPTASQAAPARTAVSGVFVADTREFVGNTAARNALRSLGVPVIGLDSGWMPAEEEIRAALLAVREIGARPYVRVHALGFDDRHASIARDWIRVARQVFGDERVYIEFDGTGAAGGVQELVDGWNNHVHTLKAAAPNSYVFLAGWATDSPAQDYAALAGASPRPDALAWSEVACGRDTADEVCQRRLPTFAWHAEKVNRAVRARIGTTIPFFVRSWNVGVAADERFQATSAIRRLTTGALNQLAGMTGQGLIGATISPAIATDDDDDHFGRGLVRRDGTLTPQGTAYRDTRR